MGWNVQGDVLHGRGTVRGRNCPGGMSGREVSRGKCPTPRLTETTCYEAKATVIPSLWHSIYDACSVEAKSLEWNYKKRKIQFKRLQCSLILWDLYSAPNTTRAHLIWVTMQCWGVMRVAFHVCSLYLTSNIHRFSTWSCIFRSCIFTAPSHSWGYHTYIHTIRIW